MRWNDHKAIVTEILTQTVNSPHVTIALEGRLRYYFTMYEFLEPFLSSS